MMNATRWIDRPRFMRSLRDARFVLILDPWVETHGYHHMVAPRPGTAGWRYARGRGCARDGAGQASSAQRGDAGTAALPFQPSRSDDRW